MFTITKTNGTVRVQDLRKLDRPARKLIRKPDVKRSAASRLEPVDCLVDRCFRMAQQVAA